MDNLLSLKFWFNLRPGVLMPVYQKTLIAFIVILAIFIVLYYFFKKYNKKNLYNRFMDSVNLFSITNIIIALIILFFTYEMVPFLSARFWFLVWGAEMAIWLFFILRPLFSISQKRRELEQEKEFKKYIP